MATDVPVLVTGRNKPYDEHMWNMMYISNSVLSSLCDNYQIIYDDADGFKPKLYQALINNNHDLVLVHVTDQQIDFLSLFLYYAKHRCQTFIIAHSTPNLKQDFIFPPNVHEIYCNTSAGWQWLQRLRIKPIVQKNLADNYHWVCLNRMSHLHRLMVASVLLGKHLCRIQDRKGLLRISSHRYNHCESWQEWYPFNVNLSVDQNKTIQYGFELMKQNYHGGQPEWSIYNKHPYLGADNVTNFLQRLTGFYQQSFVEIVNETWFFEQAGGVTEKFINSVLACNFPIMMSAAGSVAYCESLGFDMFHDVINHRYDTILDPWQRIFCAIEDNIEILIDAELAHKLWLQHRGRFLDNVAWSRFGMYEKQIQSYESRLQNLVANIVSTRTIS